VPNSSSTPPAALTPNAPPSGAGGNKPPGHSSNGAPSSDADRAADARNQDVGAEEPNAAHAAGQLDVPGVNSILSRISGALQSGANLTAPSPPAAKHK
jgi:hypothetical protein